MSIILFGEMLNHVGWSIWGGTRLSTSRSYPHMTANWEGDAGDAPVHVDC